MTIQVEVDYHHPSMIPRGEKRRRDRTCEIRYFDQKVVIGASHSDQSELANATVQVQVQVLPSTCVMDEARDSYQDVPCDWAYAGVVDRIASVVDVDFEIAILVLLLPACLQDDPVRNEVHQHTETSVRGDLASVEGVGRVHIQVEDDPVGLRAFVSAMCTH